MTELRDEPAHLWHVPRLVVAWAITAVFGVVVLVNTSGIERFHWWILVLGVSVLVTFALQLGTAQREGFINRTALSIAGSVAIIAVIEVIALILSLG